MFGETRSGGEDEEGGETENEIMAKVGGAHLHTITSLKSLTRIAGPQPYGCCVDSQPTA